MSNVTLMTADYPKRLASLEIRATRVPMLPAPYVAPLSRFVEVLGSAKGLGYVIPDFEPFDGGVDADENGSGPIK